MDRVHFLHSVPRLNPSPGGGTPTQVQRVVDIFFYTIKVQVGVNLLKTLNNLSKVLNEPGCVRK